MAEFQALQPVPSTNGDTLEGWDRFPSDDEDVDEPSTSGAVATSVVPGDSDQPRDFFRTHKVDKMDTLAGLAIKYDVTVSDIKRSNGLLSDCAMFARDTLLIPTERLPVGAEYSAWAAMIITRHGRLPNTSVPRPNGAGLLGISDPDTRNEAIEQLKRYYNPERPTRSADTNGGPNPEEFTCGALQLSDLGAYGTGLGESSQQVAITLLRDNTGGDDSVRRRRGGESHDISAGPSGDYGSRDLPPLPPRANPSGRSVSAGRGATMRSAGPPGSRETLLARLKRAASNPALSAGAQQMAAAAENVVTSISDNVRPGFKSLKKMLSNGAPKPMQERLNPKRD